MPTPLKPCDGSLSNELQEILQKNRDRAQWAAHPCQVCGQEVMVVQVKGRWVPQAHWPSVTYRPRPVKGTSAGRSRSAAKRQDPAASAPQT